MLDMMINYFNISVTNYFILFDMMRFYGSHVDADWMNGSMILMNMDFEMLVCFCCLPSISYCQAFSFLFLEECKMDKNFVGACSKEYF